MNDWTGEENGARTFYIVLREFGSGHVNQIKKQHATRADADAEAERLCREVGVRFYVMEMVGFVEQAPAPLVWTQV